MQTTLLSFMGKQEIYPIVIYLNYINNQYNVEYLNNIPLNSVLIGKIKWNYSKNDLNIYINKDLNHKKKYVFNSDYTTTNVSLLKSQLQKSIRRMDHNLSINLAYQMINLNFNEFIRRLLIITLEDVILNQYFPILTWMMIAFSTKKWTPTYDDINWILNYVNYLCNISYREFYSKIDELSPPCNYDKLLYNSLIFSMELRKSFGGMEGDMKFLNWFIKEWNTRFKINNQHIDTLYYKIELIDIQCTKLINPVDMLLDGVDFHNYPKIIELIYLKYNDLTPEEIKKTIWEYSSKTNKRKFLNNDIIDTPNVKYNNIWIKIKDFKNLLSKQYLLRNTIK